MLTKKEQLKAMTPEEKIVLARNVIQGYELDESLDDSRKRAETVLWIVTDGEQGKNWGCAGYQS